MTYLQYVTVTLGKFGLSTSEVEFILTESDLDPDDTVTTAEQKLLIKKAMYNYVPLLMSGLQNVSEGGYSVTWNLEGLRLWYSFLATELGLVDLLNVGPKVRDASNRW